ncbi:MAG: hypothetical protein R2695_00390 [Acidimicrobiales bacterium]
MSTVLETIAARHLRLEVLGISLRHQPRRRPLPPPSTMPTCSTLARR